MAVQDDLGLPQCNYQHVSRHGVEACIPFAALPCLHRLCATNRLVPRSCPLTPFLLLQYCYLDWALYCDPNSACCQQPEELFATDAPAACANRTSDTGGDAVCDYEWDCLSRWCTLHDGAC